MQKTVEKDYISMNRRRLISTVGCLSGSLAGCLGNINSSGFPRRTIHVADVEQPAPNLDTEVAVEILEPDITSDHTARLRVAVQNTSKNPRTYVFRAGGPMLNERAASNQHVVILVDPQRFKRATEDCWRPESVGTGEGTTDVELAAAEASHNTLDLWDIEEDARECMPPGDYRFSGWFMIKPQDPPVNRWAMTLKVESS